MKWFKLTMKLIVNILILIMNQHLYAQDRQLMTEEVDRLITPLVNEDLISGTILIAHQGEIFICKGYGLSNRENNIPNSQNSVYRIGSITKPFTAQAIMLMHLNGDINIDSTVSTYLPDLTNGDKITLRQLLSHTSGFKDYYYKPDYIERTRRQNSVKELVEWLQDQTLLFEPGEGFQYSSAGYIVLTAIIEEVWNGSYESFIEKNILIPAGMNNTGLDSSNLIIKNRADGYTRQPYAGVCKAEYQCLPFGKGHGGLYSTAIDLYYWDCALNNGKILNKNIQEQMYRPEIGNYGLGWMIGVENDHRVVSHGGAILGYMTEIKRFVDDDILLIALYNFETPLAEEINKRLTNIALGLKWDPVFAPGEELSLMDNLKPFIGEYEVEPGYSISLFLKDRSFIIRETGFEECPVNILSNNRIFSKEMNAILTFEHDDLNNLDRVKILQGLLYWEGAK